MEQGQIRVVIAEDHPSVRAGLLGLLKREKDIEVVGEAADGGEAVRVTRKLHPDVLLLDFQMPVMRADEVLKVVCWETCEVKVLVVSSFDDLGFIHGVMETGAQGYLIKDEVGEFLAVAIRKIAEGDEKWLSPKAALSMKAKSRRKLRGNFAAVFGGDE